MAGDHLLRPAGRATDRAERRTQQAGCAGLGDPADPAVVPPRFHLRLARQPVTQRVPFPPPEAVARGQAARLAGIPTAR